MRVSGWVSFSSHDSGRLHGYTHSLGAIQALGGIIVGPAGAQPQAETIRGPHPTTRVSLFMVGILGGLSAALGRDGDERFGGGAGWNWRRGLLIAGGVSDGWKR